jgi:hypothetical protein
MEMTLVTGTLPCQAVPIGEDQDRAWAGEMRRLRGVERPRASGPWGRIALLVVLLIVSVLLYVRFG